MATDLGFAVSSEGDLIFGQPLVGGQFGLPGPFLVELPAQIDYLASSSQQVLAETSTRPLRRVTTLATVDGGGEPVFWPTPV